jgi:predicted hydrocarbon binding protein
VEEQGDQIAFVDGTCAMCYGRHSDKPICHLYVGSLTEAVLWATGVEYAIRETHCVASGDDFCRFEIGEPVTA